MEHTEIKIGMPVMYGDLQSWVITAPREVFGIWCVNIAMVGIPVPVLELQKISNRNNSKSTF